MSELESQLEEIREEADPARRNMRVAMLVARTFEDLGCEPVVVGGSAVEFYSEGRYVSGDIDFCFTGARLPTPREREEVLAKLGKPLGVRRGDIAGVIVDLLGQVESSARTPFQAVGPLRLIQLEDLIAERLLVATVPTQNAERLEVARVLVTLVVAGMLQVDKDELLRVADSPDYRVGKELRQLMAEASSKTESDYEP
jgi:hypothetical protein